MLCANGHNGVCDVDIKQAATKSLRWARGDDILQKEWGLYFWRERTVLFLRTISLFLVMSFTVFAGDRNVSEPFSKVVEKRKNIIKNLDSSKEEGSSPDSKQKKFLRFFVGNRVRKTSSLGVITKEEEPIKDGRPLTPNIRSSSNEKRPVRPPRPLSLYGPSKLSPHSPFSQSPSEKKNSKEKESQQKIKAKLAEIGLLIYGGDFTGNRSLFTEADVHCSVLEEDEGKKSSDMRQDSEGFHDMKEDSIEPKKQSEVQLLRNELRKRGIGSFPGESKNFHEDEDYLLRSCKDAENAMMEFDVMVLQPCLAGMQKGRTEEDIEKWFDTYDAMFGTMSHVVTGDVKVQEERLNFYRELLFSTINRALSEDIKKQEEGFGYYRKLLLSAIEHVFCEDGEQQEETWKSFKELILRAAEHVLCESDKLQEETLEYYKELMLKTADRVLKVHKECLENYGELAFTHMSNILAQKIKDLEYCNALIGDSKEESEIDGHSDKSEDPKEFGLLRCFNALIFDKARKEFSEAKGEESLEYKEAFEYYDNLKLGVAKQILFHDVGEYRKKYRDGLTLLQQILENINSFRAKRKKYRKASRLVVNFDQSRVQASILASFEIRDKSLVDVNALRDTLDHFEEVWGVSGHLQEPFNSSAEKNELELLKTALKALIYIESADRSKKAHTEEA